MNLKLRIASIWLPSFMIKKELDQVAEATISSLDGLLSKQDSYQIQKIRAHDVPLVGNVEDRRRIMANAHNLRVKTLIDIMGYEEAVKSGRIAMFMAGLKLGNEARDKLGVGQSLDDLIRAAKVLYKVLGIDFEIKEKQIENSNDVTMIVHNCCLSKYYKPETCRILSAADEGVVQGLNENIHMKFTQRMTDGLSKCQACIHTKKIEIK